MIRLAPLRNVAIVLAIAAAVQFVPGGSRAASTIEAILWAAFAAAIGWVGMRLYREHRVALHSLGSTHRGILYGCVGLGAFLIAARSRMWERGGWELLWFALLGLVVYGLLAVYRFWRSY